MPIRPIDIQIAIQKSDHYTKDFNPQNKACNIQQGLAVENNKEAIKNQHQVMSTEASKNKKINRDGSNKYDSQSEGDLPGKDQKRESGEKEELLMEKDKGTFIDIII